MTVLHHKRRTVHPIFQICISRNTKCVDMPGFPRPGHILFLKQKNSLEIHDIYPPIKQKGNKPGIPYKNQHKRVTSLLLLLA